MAVRTTVVIDTTRTGWNRPACAGLFFGSRDCEVAAICGNNFAAGTDCGGLHIHFAFTSSSLASLMTLRLIETSA
jgi:hypothetical protein